MKQFFMCITAHLGTDRVFSEVYVHTEAFRRLRLFRGFPRLVLITIRGLVRNVEVVFGVICVSDSRVKSDPDLVSVDGIV